jgi:phage terminase large subunit-like protein
MITGKHADVVIEYARSIVEGRKIACVEQIQGCQRFLDDIDSGRWEIRTKDADFVIGIIEKTFKHRQGEKLDGTPLKGKPFLLEPWEKFIVYAILIFFIPGTIERRIKEAFIFVPRKNGKTIFISALAWALGLLERLSGSTVYVVGAVLKEAMKSYENWDYNISSILYADKKSAQADGWRMLDNNMEHSISHDDLDGGSMHLEALAGNPDAQDSFNCNIVIADEIHAYKSPKQYNILKEATKAYTNKLVCGITTAGDDTTSFCYQRLKYCQKILSGLIKSADADALFIFICKADENEKGDVDYLSTVEHEKANPNYGVTIRPQDIMNDALQAQNDPQQRKDFLAKSLDIYSSAMKAYFNLHEFQASDKKYNWSIPELAKLPISWYGGADLSKLHDLTAAVLYGSYGDIDIIIPHCWFPITAAYIKAEEDNIPLFGWKDDDWLTMSNNPTVNHAEIIRWFVDMRTRGFKIRQVGHDRKFCREYYIGMKAAGFAVVDQPQLYWKKNEGFRHIETKGKDGLLYYCHADPFEYCLSNVRAIEKTDDMVMYDKVEDKHRIDVFDAAVFACVRRQESLEQSEEAKKWMG